MTFQQEPIAPKHLDRVAKALYDATKSTSAAPWSHVDGSLREYWYALAVAAIDMANGARGRLTKTEGQHERS